MLRFSEFIIESGDFHYPFTHNKIHKSGYHEYNFKDHNGNDFTSNIEHLKLNDGSTHAEVVFNQHNYKALHTYRKFDLTGEAGKDSHKIMSTIHHILKHHTKSNPEVSAYHFTSDGSEPSRVKLYTKYAKKLNGETYEPYDKNTSDKEYRHVVPASSLKEEFIAESGDFSYETKHVRDPETGYHDGYHVHSFKDHSGNEFHVDIEHNHDDSRADISFGKRVISSLSQKHHITRESGVDSHKIMSTVHNIVKHHVKNNSKLKEISFTSDKNEPTRTKLYHRYAEKHGGKTIHHPADDRGYMHIIPTSSLKEEFIVESGNFSYKINHTVDPRDGGSPGYHEYEFHDHEGKKFTTAIEHGVHTGHADVEFAKGDDIKKPLDHGITGDSGTSAAKILSTVHHILKNHSRNHPKIDHYEFTSKEPSRTKLYSRYAKSLGGDTEASIDPNTKEITRYHHRIPSSSLK